MASFKELHLQQNRHAALFFAQMALNLTTQAPAIKHAININDAVLICVDFENVEALVRKPDEPNLWSQLGVCILDTQFIGKAPPAAILETYNFSTGIASPGHIHRDGAFVFGHTQHVPSTKDLLLSLNKLIDRTRNNILIAHDFGMEIQAFNTFGFDYTTGITTLLDTRYLNYAISGDRRDRISLWNLTNLLGIPIKDEEQHIGGNDANFALRAFILLTAMGTNITDTNTSNVARLQILRSIAEYGSWDTHKSSWDVRVQAVRNQPANKAGERVIQEQRFALAKAEGLDKRMGNELKSLYKEALAAPQQQQQQQFVAAAY